ncbi:MAG: methylenetetrahydrofolate reductase [Proteobacteria bacterium]|jgi:methylenetetrahydrofolate reductase (NADPH)|nr:methylenetetrahydrofolate reductase [Pseudomonadota bacterium]
MTEIFKPDRKLIDILRESSFTISAEVIPPRNGTPQTKIFEELKELIHAGSQFLSVTKGAGGSLRGGSLPIAQSIKDYFKVPAIAHFTCRDLTPQDVENQLMDHHYVGIRNILALRGDPPRDLPDWKPLQGSYSYAYQLIEQIRKLNQGQFLERPNFEIQSALNTDFCIGAAAYPDEPNPAARTEHFAAKVRAGAEYAITQMIYDVDSYSRFLEEIAKANCTVPVLPGVRILSSQKQADRMRNRFQVPIPRHVSSALPPEDSSPDQALEVFLKLVESFKKAGAPGLHVFVLTDTDLACRALRNLATQM